MTMWLAVGLVGLGSYTLRVVPLLLGERLRLPERVDAALGHAAVGAMTALLVTGVERATTDAGPDTVALGLAVAMSGTVAITRRTMPVVVLCGGATYGVALAVLDLCLS